MTLQAPWTVGRQRFPARIVKRRPGPGPVIAKVKLPPSIEGYSALSKPGNQHGCRRNMIRGHAEAGGSEKKNRYRGPYQAQGGQLHEPAYPQSGELERHF